MKTLYLTRHAKSSWEEEVIDHQRPLSKKGEKDIIKVSEYVASNFKKPDLIISSDANRALTTALQFKKAFNVQENRFIKNHDMYDFSGANVLQIIQNCSNDVDILMLFGHNHAFTVIANKLGDKYIDNLPTCGFVKIDFDIKSWHSLTKGKTIATVFPKDL
ncbi:MAG: phosphoglycerate mutase [Flavobacteriaceae bacterium CG18_big_fil_WC_8_21_14_2_50_34_36]|nr:MAG: phosphoglycerate mutase [Flavobacteriaceae bacterium CG18_big_fil_WC_8_21_14_2_50_34_36]PIV49795.1 MAG: phosphoglycerate mutase [Flavobacteriaceae bacterium CG02_land_8_20_14_3_00_34_13]PIZ07994.1 MAG: phosphoglycerate mutase [Flavobacteriaceae bacterium CG_4_10_14_0_8_um_filter_34_31]